MPMPDSEDGPISPSPAENPDLARQPGGSPWRSFLFSENFKWLVVTVAIPLSTFLFGQWQQEMARIEADRQQRIEDGRRALEAQLGDARNNVAAMTALLPALADNDPRKAKLAMIVLEQLKNAQHGDNVHIDAAIQAMGQLADDLQDSTDPADLQRSSQLQEAYGAATNAGPVVQEGVQVRPVRAAVVDEAATAKPRIVYIQIFGDSQHEGAEAARAMLRSNGIGAPGIEDVSGDFDSRRPRSGPQIRYFSDGDLGRASWLASHLSPVQGQGWTVVRARAQGVPDGQLELWWPFPPQG